MAANKTIKSGRVNTFTDGTNAYDPLLVDMIVCRLDQMERQADAIKADVLLVRRLLALAETPSPPSNCQRISSADLP